MPILQLIQLDASVPAGADLPPANFTAYAGNDVVLEIVATDAGGGPLPLTGCSVKYHLRQTTSGSELSGFPKDPVLSTNPDGAGKCTVSLAASLTASLNGSFAHSLVVTDPSVTPATVTTVMVGIATFRTGGL